MINNINYQYIMEKIIGRLNDMDTLINTLEIDDKNIFETDMLDQINQINSILDEMENKIATLKMSKNKIQEVMIENYRQKIISKSLFTQYWVLNEILSELGVEELSKITY